MSIFPLGNFFSKLFCRGKTGEVEMGCYLKNGTIDSCAYWLLTMLLPGRDSHCAGHFGDFLNIFQPNIGEDQKSLTI